MLGKRLRPLDLVGGLHALEIVHAVGLHLTDGLALGLLLLRDQHRHGIVEHRFDHRDHVQVVLRILTIECPDHLHGERRQRLVQSEVVLHRIGHAAAALPRTGVGDLHQHPGIQ